MKRTLSDADRLELEAKLQEYFDHTPLLEDFSQLLSDELAKETAQLFFDFYESRNTFSDQIASDEETQNMEDPKFLGKTGYDPELDQGRLTKQLQAVFRFLLDGRWRTQQEIADGAQVNITSIRSRLSDLRMPRWGKHTILSERVMGGNGLWRYRMIPNTESKIWKKFYSDIF